MKHLTIILGLISFPIFAQIDVAKEPHHVSIFKNNQIQILNGDLKRGDTSFFHIHTRPSLVFVFTDSHTNGQDKDLGWKENIRKAGSVIFKPFDTPQVHRTTNLNLENYQMHDVEISTNPANILVTPLTQLATYLELTNKYLLGYRIDLLANDLSFKARYFTLITVMKGANIEVKKLNKHARVIAKKDFITLEPGESIRISKTTNSEIFITEFLQYLCNYKPSS